MFRMQTDVTSILSHNVIPNYSTHVVNAFAVEVLDLHISHGYKRRHVVVVRPYSPLLVASHLHIKVGNE